MDLRPTFPRLTALAVALGVLSVWITVTAISGGGPGPGPFALPSGPPLRANPVIGPFQGMGVWLDIYDTAAWNEPAATVADMQAHGVRTLYLQTSNYNHKAAFVDQAGVTAFLDAAHGAGIAVVAWYLPGFVNPAADLRAAEAAIHFTTPAGNAFSGFGLDIESPAVTDTAVRTQRLLSLSRSLRAAAGETYPLGAVIPSPSGIAHTAGYWPGFPYRDLASIYDVIMPMTYFSWHANGLNAAHQLVTANIELIRKNVGSDQVPIHVIGGIAQTATTDATLGFVRAVRERGVIGASDYTWTGVDDAEWSILSQIRPNPVGDPALPARAGPAELGNIPGSDVTHPGEVVFKVAGKTGDRVLSLQGYDLAAGEVSVLVNWTPLWTLPAGPAAAWSGTLTQTVPDALLNDAAPNTIEIVETGGGPWGVRAVGLTKAPASSVTSAPTGIESTSSSPSP